MKANLTKEKILGFTKGIMIYTIPVIIACFWINDFRGIDFFLFSIIALITLVCYISVFVYEKFKNSYEKFWQYWFLSPFLLTLPLCVIGVIGIAKNNDEIVTGVIVISFISKFPYLVLLWLATLTWTAKPFFKLIDLFSNKKVEN